MSEVLHANIFFFITGIAVIVFTFLLSIALFHLIKILKTVRRIVDRVEEGTATIAEDLENLRTYVVEESFLSRFLKGVMSKRNEKQEEEETLSRRTPLRSLKPERKLKTELKIKNEG
jgi:predicted Holliday junction resolvase-like endonuclease